MHLRSLVSAIALGLGLIPPNHGWCAGRVDLDEAFLATFGQRAPVVRNWWQSIHNSSKPSKVVGTQVDVLDVRPEHLVPLGGGKYALISYEFNHDVRHSSGGAITVSYLERTASHWKLEQLWPELLGSGVGGQPANAGAEVHRFGGDPLFMARSAWCGMDECSEWIGVIRLSRSRPVVYDSVPAGAISPTEGSPVLAYEGNTCQNYNVRARIVPPSRNGSLFSIRYDGWTSPPGTLSPKTPLHLHTSFVPDGTNLVMQPVVPVPTCGG